MTPEQVKHAATWLEHRDAIRLALKKVNPDRWQDRKTPSEPSGDLEWEGVTLGVTISKQVMLDFLEARLAVVTDSLTSIGVEIKS